MLAGSLRGRDQRIDIEFGVERSYKSSSKKAKAGKGGSALEARLTRTFHLAYADVQAAKSIGGKGAQAKELSALRVRAIT